jgi:hypothetical protein
MQRFEVVSAYILGALIPLLEVLRRRTNFEQPEWYVDAFIAGGLLLFAAASVSRQRPYGPPLLAGAWGVLCGGLYGSFFAQLRATTAADISGLPNAVSAAFKGVIFVIAAAAFVRSVIRAGAERSLAQAPTEAQKRQPNPSE